VTAGQRARAIGLAAAAVLLATGSAGANGRYPTARFLAFAPGAAVGPQGHPLVMALQTTFGIVSTSDGGARWHLACEAAIGFATDWDPPLVISASEAVIAGLPSGLAVARPAYCAFDLPASAPVEPVLDLAIDGRGRRIVAAAASRGIAVSDDDGATWRRGAAVDRFLVSTIEIAPGHPERIYATGYLDASAVLLRSDDGGMTFAETTRDFMGGLSAYIAGVDAGDPEVIYLRIDLAEGGTTLARSADGGRTFLGLIRTNNPMTGVALAPDGRTLWAGSPGVSERDGIFRSTDAGATWQRVHQGVTPLCLRARGDLLYVCADNGRDGFALGYSRDGGATFAPLLAWKDLLGPEACPADTPGRFLCAGDWPRLRSTLVPAVVDAGSPPADAGVDASPPPSADGAGAAPVPDAGVVFPPDEGCGCALGNRARGPRGALPLSLLLLVTIVAARAHWRQR
jgi:photosystem II stability/assembly factor-like uncharacterized protein